MDKKISEKGYKKELKNYMGEVAKGMKEKDYTFLYKLISFSINNKEFMYNAMYDKGKYLIPLDFDSDLMYFRITEKDTNGGGIKYNSEYNLYVASKGATSYTKYKIEFDESKSEYRITDTEKIEKRMNYSKIKEALIGRFNIKVRKNSEKDAIIKRCQDAYIIHLDKELEEVAESLGLTYENYMKLVGNVTKSKENDYELYRAYQKRVAKKYNEIKDMKQVIDYFNTSKDPFYRAIKEGNYLITDKELMEEIIVRSYAEGMSYREVGLYYRPVERGLFTKEEYKELIKTKGLKARESKRFIPESARIAIKLYRNGVMLHELVNGVQDQQGREHTEDRYWRQYTRYLIGIVEGDNGLVLDYDTSKKESMDILISEGQGEEKFV